MERAQGAGTDDGDGSDGFSESRPCVLYPVFESYDSRTFEMARDVAEGADVSLLVVHLSGGGSTTADSRRVGRELLDNHLDDRHEVPVDSVFVETNSAVDTVVETARTHDARLVVFDEHTPDSLVHPITGDVRDRVSDSVPCDVVTVERSKGSRLASILVPIAGGPHSGLSVAVAGALARSTGAVVELFHVSESGAGVADLFEAARGRLPDDVHVDEWHLERSDVAAAVVEQADHYDVMVLGEPEKGRLRQFVFGSVTDSVSERAENTVLVARRSEDATFTI